MTQHKAVRSLSFASRRIERAPLDVGIRRRRTENRFGSGKSGSQARDLRLHPHLPRRGETRRDPRQYSAGLSQFMEIVLRGNALYLAKRLPIGDRYVSPSDSARAEEPVWPLFAR